MLNTGEGLLERNLPKEGKVFFNFTKTTSSAIGSFRAFYNISGNPDIFMQVFNGGNTFRGGYGVYKSGEKTVNSTQKVLNDEK